MMEVVAGVAEFANEDVIDGLATAGGTVIDA